MHDPDPDGMGFYTLIESRLLDESFYILDAEPDVVYATNGYNIDVKVSKEYLKQELLKISSALDTQD